jgi:hypothetical protein
MKDGDPINAPVELAKFRKKRAEFVWECGCGGQHFYLHRDGTIECRSCKLVKESIEWIFRGQASQLDRA